MTTGHQGLAACSNEVAGGGDHAPTFQTGDIFKPFEKLQESKLEATAAAWARRISAAYSLSSRSDAKHAGHQTMHSADGAARTGDGAAATADSLPRVGLAEDDSRHGPGGPD